MIRRASGYCSIGWRQGADTDGFKLSRASTNYKSGAGPGTSQCDPDAAIILGNGSIYSTFLYKIE